MVDKYTKGLVSVIIPTYNRFEGVQTAINSVLNQTHKNTEVIVIDDCSEDKRYEQLDTIYSENKNVKILHLPINMRKLLNLTAAQGATRAEGIKIARGEYIAFLDDDDFFISPLKLETQINALVEFPNIKICFTNMYAGYGVYHSEIKMEPYHKNKIGFQLASNLFLLRLEDIMNVNYVNNSTVILDRETYDKTEGLRAETNEDYELWKRVMKHTDCLYISDCMIYYDLAHCNGKNYVYV